jgi:hypothetical protein
MNFNESFFSENNDYEYLILFDQNTGNIDINENLNLLNNILYINNDTNSKIKKSRARHTNLYLDNIRIKIVIHFCNFLIQFLNDYVKKIFGYQKRKFRKIKHDLKINIFGKLLSQLMNMTIEEFCKLHISTKYRKRKENQNEINFNYLKDYFENEFDKKKLKDFFFNFYMEDNIEKIEKIKKDYGLNNILNFKCLCKKQKSLKYVIKLKQAALRLNFEEEPNF